MPFGTRSTILENGHYLFFCHRFDGKKTRRYGWCANNCRLFLVLKKLRTEKHHQVQWWHQPAANNFNEDIASILYKNEMTAKMHVRMSMSQWGMQFAFIWNLRKMCCSPSLAAAYLHVIISKTSRASCCRALFSNAPNWDKPISSTFARWNKFECRFALVGMWLGLHGG